MPILLNTFKLPSDNSHLSEMFSVVDDIVPIMRREYGAIHTLRETVVKAREYLAAEKSARSVNSVVVRADGKVQLITIGKRGGWRVRWTFGSI